MKTLSIRQPWAWAIMHGGKDIENRDWPTKIRGRVWVHASQGMTSAEYDEFYFMVRYDFGGRNELLETFPPKASLIRGAIIGSVEIVDCVTESDSPWFFGKYGFVLKDPRLFPKPIPYRGRLGFFEVNDALVDLFVKQVSGTGKT
jgi:hypothetical protein